jgi:integrase
MGQSRMPFLQPVRGKFRVRVLVPEHLQPHLPPPHVGKKALTKALKTGNEREANRLSVPHIAEFHAIIAKTEARVGGLSELAAINCDDLLMNPQQIHHASAVMQRFLSSLNLPVPVSERLHEPVTFEGVIAKWGRGKSKQAVDNMTAKCRVFADHLGHDDMTRVEFAECRDWRDEMIDEDEIAPGTISNRIKLVKRIFAYAFENELITANHMVRVKYSPGEGVSRDDFTPDERRDILTMARKAEPHIHWLNFMCSYHGPRTGEIADMTTLDIECIEGIWLFVISTKNRNRDQRLKTPVSTRRLAFHQAVLDEGFIDYRDQVVRKYGHGPLFPDVRLDQYGRRAAKAAKDLSEWLRGVVKITDPSKPFYSHRHTATSYLRNTLAPDGSPVVKEDIERYILGHSKKGSHAGYGRQWFETLKAAVEVIPNPFGDEKDTSLAEAAE